MKYPQIQGLEEEKFRRLTGVKRSTFEKMINILKDADIKKNIPVIFQNTCFFAPRRS